MLDMGPYYLTALINLLGPIQRVAASTGKGRETRTITSEKKNGKVISVETPTHLAGVVDFANGAIGTLVMSFDVWQSDVPRIEIHGTEGSLSVPDPNTFGGPIKMRRYNDDDWREVPITEFGYTENARGIGLADMAVADMANRPHRVSGDLALHVLEVMLSFESASDTGQTLQMETIGHHPAPLPAGQGACPERDRLS